MSFEPLSSLHPRFPGGHTHPSHVITTMPPADLVDQHLEVLLAGVTFDISTRGLACSSHAPPHKMHCPRLRKSQVQQQAISHLDTISCWKGISNAQALELTLWERLFHQSLVSKIEERLRSCIINKLKEREELVNEPILLSLLQTLPEGHDYIIDIEVVSLLHMMIDAFYADYPSQTAARNFRWSLTSGDLPSFVYNFLLAQDCFHNTQHIPRLSVECSLHWCTFPVLTVIAKVAWQPPTIQLLGIPAQLRPKGHYVIAPRSVSATKASGTLGYAQYSNNTEYTVKRSSSKVQWDHASELFRAQAPDKVEGGLPTVSETIVQANLTTQFPEGVQLERASRYAIKVEVVDACRFGTTVEKHGKQHKSPLDTHMQPRRGTRINQLFLRRRRLCSRLLDCPPQALPSSIEQRCSVDSYSDPGMSSENATAETEMQDLAHSEAPLDSHSPRKRKISLCENVVSKPEELCSNELHEYSSEVDLKRRKMKQPDVTNSLVALTPLNQPGLVSCPSEGHEPDTILKAFDTLLQCVKTRSPQDEEHKGMVRRLGDPVHAALTLVLASVRFQLSDSTNGPPKEACEKPESTATLQCPTPPRRASDSRYSDRGSPDGTSNPSDIDVPGPPKINITSGSKHFSELSQEIIRHNYEEFMEVARRKTLEQPDVGDMSFEKIFMGDSEAESWHSSDVGDASGLSGDMSGLDIDED